MPSKLRIRSENGSLKFRTADVRGRLKHLGFYLHVSVLFLVTCTIAELAIIFIVVFVRTKIMFCLFENIIYLDKNKSAKRA